MENIVLTAESLQEGDLIDVDDFVEADHRPAVARVGKVVPYDAQSWDRFLCLHLQFVSLGGEDVEDMGVMIDPHMEKKNRVRVVSRPPTRVEGDGQAS